MLYSTIKGIHHCDMAERNIYTAISGNISRARSSNIKRDTEKQESPKGGYQAGKRCTDTEMTMHSLAEGRLKEA